MRWERSHRADRRVARMADRHYPRQSHGSPQFVAPGFCLVFVTPAVDAYWVTRRSLHADHEWPGAWECAAFRNESGHLSSALITEAVAATRYLWGDPPPQGFITFVDAGKVRRKRDPGRCYRKAGWRRIGTTKGGKLVFGLAPADFPLPMPPLGELPLEASHAA